MANARNNDAPAAPPGGMSPGELFAVACVGKDTRKWRSELPVGFAQPIDVMLRIEGALDVADSQTAAREVKPDLGGLQTDVFSCLGPKQGQTLFEKLVGEAPIERRSQARARAIATVEARTTLETQTKAGNVTGPVTITRYPGPHGT